jgi:hypothetical protein
VETEDRAGQGPIWAVAPLDGTTYVTVNTFLILDTCIALKQNLEVTKFNFGLALFFSETGSFCLRLVQRFSVLTDYLMLLYQLHNLLGVE